MRSTSFFLLLPLLPACADVSSDPNRQPPGQPQSDESSSSDAAMNDDGDVDTADDDGGADDSSDESTDDGVGETEEPDDMPCGDLCLARAPSGWHGPAALVRSSSVDEAPACGDSHPVELATLVSDLVPQPAICDCNCGEAVGSACTTATARVYESYGCSDLIQIFPIGLSCTNEVDPIDGYWNILFDPPNGGECEALPSFSIPELDYTRWTLCGAEASDGECPAGESCTTAAGPAFEQGQCIWQEGDLACPGDIFTERTLVYSEVTDDRSCGECSCGEPTGTCAGGEVLLDYTPTCPGETYGSWYAEPGECLELLFESGMITEEATPFASCEPTMPVSLGAATLEQPYTVCCAAE